MRDRSPAPADRGTRAGARSLGVLVLAALLSGVACVGLSPAAAEAQEDALLHGRVVDGEGAPVTGARVRVPGADRSTATDASPCRATV